MQTKYAGDKPEPLSEHGLERTRGRLAQRFGRGGGLRPQDALDAGTTNLLAVMLAGAATLRVAADLWSPRRTTQSWRKGYEGEVLTGAHLGGLPDSFVVLHDVRLPGGRENIDHLVIGPTGVFTIETKHYSSDITIRHGAARCAGRNMDKVVAQANRQANAIRCVLGASVQAVVCLEGASVQLGGLFAKPVVDGVRFCSGGRLAKFFTGGTPRLGSDGVETLATVARAQLRPAVLKHPPTKAAVPKTCPCGAAQVMRRRNSDGRPFWGCSRFLACPNTSTA